MVGLTKSCRYIVPHRLRQGGVATGNNIRDASEARRGAEQQMEDSMADKTCLVCTKVIADGKEMKWNHEGKWLVFDDMGCRNRFIGNPKKYLEAPATT